MNRRRLLNGINRRIDQGRGVNAVAWFYAQSFHQSAAEMPFDRLSIADLDKAGPRLVTTPPVERAICIYCTEVPASEANSPYCSNRCAISAENS